MDKELEERLERFGKSPGKLIGSAKRKWGDSQKKVIIIDEMSREEQAIFKNDPVLMDKMLKILELEVEIKEHIQKNLMIFRESKSSKPSFLKDGAVIKEPVFKKEFGK